VFAGAVLQPWEAGLAAALQYQPMSARMEGRSAGGTEYQGNSGFISRRPGMPMGLPFPKGPTKFLCCRNPAQAGFILL